MSKTILVRYGFLVQVAKAWLGAKSETGTLLMGEDGPVTRREVMLVNLIILLVIVGVCAADGALWLTAVCVVCAGVLVRLLKKVSTKNINKEDNGK